MEQYGGCLWRASRILTLAGALSSAGCAEHNSTSDVHPAGNDSAGSGGVAGTADDGSTTSSTDGSNTTAATSGEGGAAGAKPTDALSGGAAGSAGAGGRCDSPLLVSKDGACLGTGYEAKLEFLADDPGACRVEVPQPPKNQGIDLEQVTLVYSLSDEDHEVPRLASDEDCESASDGGWVFDESNDNSLPSYMILCPCSCAAMESAHVEVRLGCSSPFP